MRLMDYTSKHLILFNVSSEERWDLFAQLVNHITNQHQEIDGGMVLNRILERESTARTGLENGIALPHAMVQGLEEPICLVAKLSNPFDFGTIDGSPVDILFMLVSPANNVSSHIRILARIARLCSNQQFVQAMRDAPNQEVLYQVIKEEDARHV